MTIKAQRGGIDFDDRRSRLRGERRRPVALRPLLHELEDRTLLSTDTWLPTTGGDWDTAGNWSLGRVPTASDDAVINLTSTGSVTLSSNLSDSVNSLSTNSKTTVKVQNGSLSVGAGSSSLAGPVDVSTGATLSVASGASVQIPSGETLTDDGTINFGAATVTMGAGCCVSLGEIAVSGTLTANGTTFANSGDGGKIVVNSGGIITPVSSSFNVTLFVPYDDVPSLAAGNNVSFGKIEINSGTLPSGNELDLDLIGTNTANLAYIFPGNFTVALGATLNVGTDVPVQMPAGVTLTDNGTLSFGDGDTVTMGAGCCVATAEIAVSGTMNTTGTTFADTGDGGSIVVSSGGMITPTDSTFGMPLFVPYNDVAVLAAGNNVSFNQIEIDSGTMPSGNELDLDQIGTNTANLSYVIPGAFTVASGATLNVGTNVPLQIPAPGTLTDNGTLSFGEGDTVTMGAGCCVATAEIAVAGTLTTTGTTFVNTGDGGSIVVSSGGMITPTGSSFGMPLFVPYSDVALLAAGNNVSFDRIEIDAGSMPRGYELDLDLIGTKTTNLIYVIPGAFTVASGATLNVGTNVPVQIPAGGTLTDNGMMSLGEGDTVTMGAGCCVATAEIAVAGTLTTTGTTFVSAGDGGSIVVSSGGMINPTGSSFGMPLFVPYNDVALLAAGNNVMFDQVEIDPGSMPGGYELDLDLIGTNTANLSYYITGDFTVAVGATLKVGTSVSVQVPAGATLTDDGTLSFDVGDTVAIGAGCCVSVGKIAVAGTMTATGTNFAAAGDGGSVVVNSGGTITATDVAFSKIPLTLNSGSNDTLHFDTFTGHITINSGATINVSGNDFSNVGSKGVIAAGESTATIVLEENYWGSTDTTTIETLIDDHHVSASLPTIAFEPVWSTNSGTIATPETVFYSPDDQTFNLSATVSTTSGNPITGGTETFTILSGGQVIGDPTAAEPVANGSVTASYTLPGGTAIGTYTIEADYSGYGVYPASTDTSQTLTVSKAPASQIAITSSPLALVAGTRGQVTVQLEDSDGDPGAASSDPQTITLSTTSGAGAFYAAASGGTPITSVAIPAGQSVATFYYYDTMAGGPTVTASDTAFNSAPSQVESVSPAAAAKLAITNSPLSLVAGSRGAVIVGLEDQYNNPDATAATAQTINLFTTSPNGAFYTNPTGGSPITSVVVPGRPERHHFLLRRYSGRGPTITADDVALSSSVTQGETISPGPANHEAITSTPIRGDGRRQIAGHRAARRRL